MQLGPIQSLQEVQGSDSSTSYSQSTGTCPIRTELHPFASTVRAVLADILLMLVWSFLMVPCPSIGAVPMHGGSHHQHFIWPASTFLIMNTLMEDHLDCGTCLPQARR